MGRFIAAGKLDLREMNREESNPYPVREKRREKSEGKVIAWVNTRIFVRVYSSHRECVRRLNGGGGNGGGMPAVSARIRSVSIRK